MRILLSAYACEPNRGSEPEVGWSWAMELCRMGHEVWVLTRSNNRSGIETFLSQRDSIPNLHFLYYDLPTAWTRKWKKWPGGLYLYYFLWQWGAYRLAKKAHRAKRFDCVHHITFASVRQPSFMGNLDAPFIFGPVGGGERAPWPLRKGYGIRGRIVDAIRDASNWLVRLDPFMHETFRRAQSIYACTLQTKEVIPERYQEKVRLQLAIGIKCKNGNGVERAKLDNNDSFRILFVGRFLYWKGMHLGMAAFKKLVSEFPNARLTMVGKGPDGHRWKLLAQRLGIESRIDWIPWIEKNELPAYYKRHHVFLFPSLHDSGGQVVLEAMSHGLPVVCLNLGGPGEMVDETCGLKVDTESLSEERVVMKLADSLIQLAKNPELINNLSKGATERIKEFSWPKIVERFQTDATQFEKPVP